MTEPKIVENLLSKEDYDTLYGHLFNLNKESDWGDEESGTFLSADPDLGRHLYSDQVIEEYGEKLVPLAREIFNNETLLLSYSLFSHYEGPNANLHRHKDSNACTYTLDMCLYQTKSWDIGVNHDGVDTMYTLEPNQALAFYGNDQEHWRNEYEGTEKDYVGMIFFHFVEPDHWFFTKSPRYIEVVSGRMTEEEWKNTKF
jgi:hypothetical protein